MKKYFFLFLLLCSANSYSGDLFIILYRGHATSFNGDKTVDIPSYKKYKLLPNSMSIEFKGNPVFIIYSTDNKYLDRLDSYKGKISCSSFASKLKPVPSPYFHQIINSYDELRDTEEKTKATVRAGTKGLNNKRTNLKELEEYVFPTDSTRVIGNTVTLQWKTKNKLLGGMLTITNSQTGAEILNQPIEQEGSFSLPLTTAGWYSWEITSSEENKLIESNSLKKLFPEESKAESIKLENFKNSISDLLEETQQYLIDGYLEQNLLEN